VPARVHARGETLEGPIAATLATAAEEQDVLVCGSRDRGPLGRVVLGSISHALLHGAPCPLIVLPRTARMRLPEQAPVAAVA
jgi:nucleotide-binding universal stress UspA family protein